MSDTPVNNYLPSSIRLKTVNGHYVCAEGGGGGLVVANRQEAHAWETFTLTDLTGAPGSRLQHGSRIALRASGGKYVYPEGGGGGRVVAKGPAIGGWEPLTMVSVDGKIGSVVSGDHIALRAIGGQYLYPEGGGGAGLVAKGPAIGGWEPFEIQIGPQRINLQASNRQFAFAERGGGMAVLVGNPPESGWDSFYLFDLRGTLPLQNGDLVSIGTHDLRYLLGLNSLQRVVATATHPLYAATFNVIILDNPMTRVYRVALRARSGKYVAAEGGGGSFLAANQDAVGPSETFTLRLPETFGVGGAW